MTGSLAASLRNALVDFLSPLESAAGDPRAAFELLSSLGHTASTASNPPLQQIFQQTAALIDQLKALDAGALDSWEGIQAVLNIGTQASTILSELKQLTGDPAFVQAIEGLAEDLLAVLTAGYLRRNHQTLFRTAGLLTLVDAREFTAPDAPIQQGDTTLRYPRRLDRFNFDAVQGLLSQPGKTLKDAYLPNDLATAPDAWTGAGRLFPYLGILADALKLASSEGSAPSNPTTLPPADDDTLVLDDNGSGLDDENASTLPPVEIPESFWSSVWPTFRFVLAGSGTGAEMGIALIASSREHPGSLPGYLVTPFGSFNTTVTGTAWKLTISSQAQIPALVIGPSGVSIAPQNTPISGGTAKILVEAIPAEGSTGPAFVFGSTTGTRLEIGSAAAELDLFFSPERKAVVLGINAKSGAVVVTPGDGDGFISHVLPSGGLRCNFDFGMSLGSDSGLSIRGGAGLDVTVPVGLSIGGVITIPSIHLGLKGGAGGVQSEISLSAGLSLGPLQLSVNRIGLDTILSFPSSGGNLGIADLSLAFRPPTGVGLSIDAAGINGGGALDHDPEKKEYSGVLQLEFNQLALQAFGLITTEVAGSAGYSLFALIDADFPPVQLGWGFELNGVGGLVGVNRTASTDALRAALKKGTLSSVLFPKNAITNAGLILSQLDAFFPAASGRFVFGPMALITWGTPTLLTASLAVILELPEPIRIILLAIIAVRLPSESNALVRVNMDALGVLDLTNDDLSLDATLFDSRLLDFTLSGDMALRANWGSQREFLLAIGGFHPRFQPPAGFPPLQRIVISMPSGPIAKLNLAAYLAVTSNTVQFGATLDVFIGVAGFGLSGHLGFDALLGIEPFQFDADISGKVALTAGGDDLTSVDLEADLTGPSPWYISGKFTIHLFIVDLHKHFSHTWGQSGPSTPPQTVDVLALLTTALADARNWTTQMPANIPALVSVRSADPGVLIAHPLAPLEVHETVVPLDIAIDKFGAATPAGSTTFTIGDLVINRTSVAHEPVQDDFAPAQFFSLSDDEELARPSFERHDAGVRTTGGLAANGAVVAKNIAYETFYVDSPGGALREDTGVPQPVLLLSVQAILTSGAAGKAQIWKSGKRRYPAKGQPISVLPPKFVIADTSNLTAAGVGNTADATYSAMAAALAAEVSRNPQRRGSLEIVASHEVVL
jgi:hypothetical protein